MVKNHHKITRLTPIKPTRNQHWTMAKIPTWLVVSTPLKNMKVSWDDYPIYYGK